MFRRRVREIAATKLNLLKIAPAEALSKVQRSEPDMTAGRTPRKADDRQHRATRNPRISHERARPILGTAYLIMLCGDMGLVQHCRPSVGPRSGFAIPSVLLMHS
jgi:hypothetical protein